MPDAAAPALARDSRTPVTPGRHAEAPPSDAGAGAPAPLGDAAFAQFQQLLLRAAGISLAPGKKALVAGRLAKRLRHHRLDSYDAYHRLLAVDADERRVAIDLLTTNETRFFREGAHFDLLRERIVPGHPANRPLRVWSAAASSGQEAYSVAMVLASHATGDWEIFGSDLSTRVLEHAQRAQYELREADGIPKAYLHAHCLRGIGAQAGTFAIAPALRRRVQFAQVNLNEPLPDVGLFDVILLRNVLIYFQPDTKRRVIERVLERLRPGGWFLVGHSESLSGLATGLTGVAPSVYRKP